LAIPRIAPDVILDVSGVATHTTEDDAEVFLAGFPGSKGLGQGAVGVVRFGDHKTAAGVLIEPVDDTGAFGISDPGQFFPQWWSRP